MTSLSLLLDDLRAAQGPSRELDARTYVAIGGALYYDGTLQGWEIADDKLRRPNRSRSDIFPNEYDEWSFEHAPCPKYTASLDAALTLGRDATERARLLEEVSVLCVLEDADPVKDAARLFCIAALSAREKKP